MDTERYLAINSFARSTPWLHWLAAQYALWGGLALLVALLVLGWVWARRRPNSADRVAVAVLTGASAVVAVLLNQHLISPSIARIRPCSALSHVEALLACTHDYSMPSDHCIIAGALTAGMWILNRRFGCIATILAVLLAFGRVYAGMHYPSDTLVGLLAGAAIGVIVVLALRGPLRALLGRIAPSHMSILVTGRQPHFERAISEAWRVYER